MDIVGILDKLEVIFNAVFKYALILTIIILGIGIVIQFLQKRLSKNKPKILEGQKSKEVKIAVTKFEELTVTDPRKAIDILFNQALKEIPELTTEQYKKAFKRMLPSSAKGEGTFKEGTENFMKKILLKNAISISKKPGFKNFTINVCLADIGYEGEEAAQLWVWPSGYRVHILKTRDTFHVLSPRPMLMD